ncbi:predicted protein [Phaeodactylum tricornutum CCAP 1055/1]|jgi:hypothetical protein|uniref:Uncharacterized protein n=2 Tax=Phaeodactylum tricornutum TaxID=2850 RepID=B7FPJ7_PHATC|nr:predicted protein [Phaeodactylum tricornutum CCAP 1055/1]EEC51189.1 predicted protein [Phaeodactylum tricornutum CCAP 1055/1]|eukprot:XP_002176726.1 predicted protein [Phaeodactylum tricornutum CCAP 1055/1]
MSHLISGDVEASQQEPLLNLEIAPPPESNRQIYVGSGAEGGDGCDEVGQYIHGPHSLILPELSGVSSALMSSPGQTKPLAFATTTPLLIKLVLPILILSTHGLFLYGQIKPMWRLTQRVHVDVWANATSTEARVAVDTLKIPHENEYNLHQVKNIRTFTYAYAIQELWKAKHMPGKLLPRIAAVLLGIFSGLWPHLKLVLLMLTWFLAKQPIRRKRILNALSVLGKWSLVDVLVVCVMVGVLNLQWEIRAETIQQGVLDNLPIVAQGISTLYNSQDICSQALHYSCQNPSKLKHKIQCHACLTTVETFFKYPLSSGKPILKGFSTSGGGEAELFVAGLNGIYSFCGAVILSILLSLVVDWYDHRARDHEFNNTAFGPGRGRLNTEEHDSIAPEVSGTLSQDHELLLSLTVPCGVDHRSDADRELDRQILESSRSRSRWISTTASTLTAFFILAAVTSTTMQRMVNGALPSLLHDILGVEWTRSYSFLQLAKTLGAAGGWDWLLMGTFALFIVVGPLIRSLLCFMVFNKKHEEGSSIRRRVGRKTLAAVEFIGAFCAWEVFVVAVLMVDLLMPAITSTIILDQRCSELTNDSTCLEVKFEMLYTFGWVVMGGVFLVLVSQRIRLAHSVH